MKSLLIAIVVAYSAIAQAQQDNRNPGAIDASVHADADVSVHASVDEPAQQLQTQNARKPSTALSTWSFQTAKAVSQALKSNAPTNGSDYRLMDDSMEAPHPAETSLPTLTSPSALGIAASQSANTTPMSVVWPTHIADNDSSESVSSLKKNPKALNRLTNSLKDSTQGNAHGDATRLLIPGTEHEHNFAVPEAQDLSNPFAQKQTPFDGIHTFARTGSFYKQSTLPHPKRKTPTKSQPLFGTSDSRTRAKESISTKRQSPISDFQSK